MNQTILSPEQARKIILDAAGLTRKGQFGKGREAVYNVINHLGYVQLDTNYVVERAHHHAIAARVPDYKLEWLEDLQEEGRIFEFLTADSGYLPMGDFRFSLAVKESFRKRRKEYPQPEINMMEKVLDRVTRDGPLTVKDFEDDRQTPSSGWWDWRPAKIMLERLYYEGSLIVTRKKDFRKLYDLPRNLIPADINMTPPTPAEFAQHVILRNLQALGIAYAKDLAWRARFVKDNLVKKELPKLVEEGVILSVAVEGVKTAPLYMLPVYKKKKIQLSGDTFILSPFDTLNVFRHRLRDFFDFDYQVECFVPEPKRKYGYFCLPILIGDRFVARMDAKADRKQQVLMVHNLHFEAVELGEEEVSGIAGAIRAFAGFNGCRELVFVKCNKKQYLKGIKAGI